MKRKVSSRWYQRQAGVGLFALAFLLLGQSDGRAESTRGPDVTSVTESEAALRKAVTFFVEMASDHGGYVWKYSADMKHRFAIRKIPHGGVLVKDPGTASVGQIYLDAYKATGDAFYLNAARDVAHALLRGQLASGGWGYYIYWDAAERAKIRYRVEADVRNGENFSSLDDDTTQSAIRFLANYDETTGFSEPGITGAVVYALEKLVAAQQANGGWLQRFASPPLRLDTIATRAAFPPHGQTHPAEHRDQYRDHYTLNDGVLPNTVRTLLLAHRVYGDARWLAAAQRAGDFAIIARMPDPQPAWAQQYDRSMMPSWGRAFEPPAIATSESIGVIRTLLELFEATGEQRYLGPIGPALDYLERSVLPDGFLPRFLELETNRPIYFSQTFPGHYVLTYEREQAATSYRFFFKPSLATLRERYEKALNGRAQAHSDCNVPRLRDAARVKATELDDRGAWIDKGVAPGEGRGPSADVVSTRTFLVNARAIVAFLSAAKSCPGASGQGRSIAP